MERHKGWVYFTCDEYITIEVGTKPKPILSKQERSHTSMCFIHDHHQLEYKGKGIQIR